MDLLQIMPVVERTQQRPGAKPLWEVRAWLRCLFCGTVKEVATPPQRLDPTLLSWESRVSVCLNKFQQHQTCNNCGLVSTLPVAQIKPLTKQLERLLTNDWAEAQLSAAPPAKPALRQDLEQILNQNVTEFLHAHLTQLIESIAKRVIEQKS